MPRSAPVALRGDVEVPKSLSRTWAAAGVALAGASILAVAPGVHSEAPTAYKATEATVRLAADWKPLEPYIDAFNTASKNAAALADNYFLAPGLPLQQVIANQARYLNEVLNDPSKADDVLKEMRANLESVIAGLTGIGASGDTLDTMKTHSVDGLHGLVMTLLPSLLPAGGAIDPETISAIVNVLASPMSGVLMGLIGPVVSPAVAVLNSGIAIAAAIQAGDPDAVFSDVFSAPANVVGAVFNGATLDLTALTPLINDSGLMGTTKLNSLDVAFGGLFTPGSIGRDPYEGPDGTKITAPGGSILNSIGLGVDLNGIEIPIPGQAVGPIGAMQGLGQTVGALLGDGWDGKSGKVVPPLSGLQFPTISDDAPANWAAAIQKLADTLLGNKHSATPNSPDSNTATNDKTAAPAVTTTAVQLEATESAKHSAVAATDQSPSAATEEAEAGQQDSTGQSAGTTTAATESSAADTSSTTPSIGGSSTPESSAPSMTAGEKSTSAPSTSSGAGASSTSGSATGAASTGTSESSGEASATSAGTSSSSPSGSTSTGGSTSTSSAGSGASSKTS